MQETKPDSIQVQAFNLAEYSEIVQKHFQDGYRFDFVSNANYPTSFGTFYTCTMVLVKEQPVEAPEESTAASDDKVEGQVPVATKGRPKKV